MDHDHGSTTSDGSSMDSMMMMTPYFHFTGGDNLFFKSLTPSSKGALAGAAILLFFLALLERFVVSYRARLEASWDQKVKAMADAANARLKEKDIDGNSSTRSLPLRRTIPPFIPSHDITRGVMHAIAAFLHFALMLAVMTFQGAYFITIVVGLAVGEVVFGRLLGNVRAHGHGH